MRDMKPICKGSHIEGPVIFSEDKNESCSAATKNEETQPTSPRAERKS